jgi:hypothetical protein
MTPEDLRRLCETALITGFESVELTVAVSKSIADNCIRLLDQVERMRGVVEAAKAVTSIYDKMKTVENLDVRRYYAVMQEFCDEYGALKIRLRKLESPDAKA